MGTVAWELVELSFCLRMRGVCALLEAYEQLENIFKIWSLNLDHCSRILNF